MTDERLREIAREHGIGWAGMPNRWNISKESLAALRAAYDAGLERAAEIAVFIDGNYRVADAIRQEKRRTNGA